MCLSQPVCYYHLRLFRCLVLWSHDTNLDDALKLAKSILIPIDVLNALWPCPGKTHYSSFKHFPWYRHLLSVIQQKCDSLRQQLVEACTSTNVELPFPPSYSVPSFLRSWYDPFFSSLVSQNLPRYLSNENFDFCYLLLFLVQLMQPFVLFHVLINWTIYSFSIFAECLTPLFAPSFFCFLLSPY